MVLLAEDTLTIEELAINGYEKVVHIRDEKVGLNAIISIHSNRLGPALGGIRIYPYASFDDALNDVLRLSKAMTYKSALAECRWGGGKSVIIADPKTQKTEALLLSFAKAIDSLKGRYIAAEDVGCTPDDVAIMAQITPYVVGLHHKKSSGNPAPYTAWGTYRGIQAVCKTLFGSDSVEGKTVAIQGLGSVGSALAEFLYWHGANLLLSDIDAAKAMKLCDKYGATFIDNKEIHKQECDVYAPCALGGAINANTIPELRCKAVAGCANNQLLHDTDADELKKRGILYAPDFIINAGGLINVTNELEPGGYSPISSRNKVNILYEQLITVFKIAEQNKTSTHSASIALGDYRLEYQIGKRLEPVEFPFAKNNSQ